jgi:hypothetical protein
VIAQCDLDDQSQRRRQPLGVTRTTARSGFDERSERLQRPLAATSMTCSSDSADRSESLRRPDIARLVTSPGDCGDRCQRLRRAVGVTAMSDRGGGAGGCRCAYWSQRLRALGPLTRLLQSVLVIRSPPILIACNWHISSWSCDPYARTMHSATRFLTLCRAALRQRAKAEDEHLTGANCLASPAARRRRGTAPVTAPDSPEPPAHFRPRVAQPPAELSAAVRARATVQQSRRS